MDIKQSKILQIQIKKKLNLTFLANYETFSKWSWIVFSDIDKYIIWDNIKNIDWKVSSRKNDIYIKKHNEEKQKNILLILDLTQSMYFWYEEKTKKDLSVEILYLIAFSEQKLWNKVWIILYNESKYDFIDFADVNKNIIIFEKRLDLFVQNNKIKTDKNINISNIINNFYFKDKLVFFLTDKFEENKNIVQKLVNKNDLIYIHIFDFFENNLNHKKWFLNLWWLNNFLNIDLSNENKIKDFQNLRKRKIDDFKKMILSFGCRYIYLDTKSDIFRELYIFSKNHR